MDRQFSMAWYHPEVVTYMNNVPLKFQYGELGSMYLANDNVPTKLHVYASKPDGSQYAYQYVRLMTCKVSLNDTMLVYKALKPTSIDRKYLYIRVHDPATCECKYRIRDWKDTVIQQPGPNTLSQDQAQHGATIFNSLYFLRQDGERRNALGHSLKSKVQRNGVDNDNDNDERRYARPQSRKLFEICRFASVKHLVHKEEHITNAGRLFRWMNYYAEVINVS